MKVLHCINSPHIGGIERLVIELATEQKRKGIDVSIMLDTRKGQYAEYLMAQNIPILDSGIKGGFDMSLTTYKKLKQIFNTFQIIHLHSFSPIRSIAAKASSSKVVYTIHGLSKGIRNENKIKYLVREKLKRHFLNAFDVFVANSQHTLAMAKQHYGLKNITTMTILNGVKFLNSKLDQNSNSEDFVIGLVSRFTYRKRIDRLVNAFNIFLKNGGEGQLVLVGDGEAYNDIKDQIQMMNLSDKIELVGYTNSVEDYYVKFDVCAHPSDNEGFGLVAVEAYSFGKPVIAFSDSGGLVEVVAPLEPENIVKTEAEMAERLIWFSNHKEQILLEAKKRKAYAETNFSIERMERNYYSVYKNLI